VLPQHHSKHVPVFCDRSVLQIFSQFALLSYSTSDRLTILLAQNCRCNLFCFVSAALSQSPLCFVTTALLNSSLPLSVY
jgi:hypothetical protein